MSKAPDKRETTQDKAISAINIWMHRLETAAHEMEKTSEELRRRGHWDAVLGLLGVIAVSALVYFTHMLSRLVTVLEKLVQRM